jgi:hypothetical protein
MRTVFRLVMGAALLGALTVGATSAASARPIAAPKSFAVVVTLPSTVVRGQSVTASVSITNLTEFAAVAQGTWMLVPPKVTARTGPFGGNFALPVAAGKTVVKELTFKVPMGALPGAYNFTVNVVGGLASAVAIVNVT